MPLGAELESAWIGFIACATCMNTVWAPSSRPPTPSSAGTARSPRSPTRPSTPSPTRGTRATPISRASHRQFCVYLGGPDYFRLPLRGRRSGLRGFRVRAESPYGIRRRVLSASEHRSEANAALTSTTPSAWNERVGRCADFSEGTEEWHERTRTRSGPNRIDGPPTPPSGPSDLKVCRARE